MSGYPQYPPAFPNSGSPGVTSRRPAYPPSASSSYTPLPYAGASASGSGSGPSPYAAAAAAQTLERQNDDHVDRLHEKAAMLKHMTLNLGEQIDESNRFLDGMSNTFSQTEGLLGSATRRVKEIGRAGGANLWCYMTLFVVAVLFFVYFALWRR
ncbi:hypothetical protein BC828DRAFT_374176 [Blastocladiella britannica]|nr:hypothetical protein BC828DRAFT_374176 [Blastocladiella britannica]